MRLFTDILLFLPLYESDCTHKWLIVEKPQSPTATAPSPRRTQQHRCLPPACLVEHPHLLMGPGTPSPEEAVEALRLWLLGAFDSLAMGNYPFASAYISGDPAHPLPPWPMRVACARLHGVGGPGPEPRLAALREAVAVLYNASGAARCYSLAQVGPAAGADDIWGRAHSA